MGRKGVLLSGGMDSIAVTYWKRPEMAFTINYGQKAAIAEIRTAKQVCKTLQIEHHIINVDCSSLGTGEMSGAPSLSISPAKEWWPYRNQLLITLACMKGISNHLSELYVGSVATDELHMDGTRDFYFQISSLMEMQESNIKVSAPAIEWTTPELIKQSNVPKSLLYWAHSCHSGNQACMKCSGCMKYLATLQALGYENR